MNSSAAALLLTLACAIAAPALSQDSDVSGTVRDGLGNPLPGIKVTGWHHHPAGGAEGSYSTTNAQGRFELKSVGRVVFFRDPKFQPLSYIRRAEEMSFTVTLQPGSEDRQLPNCPSGKEPGKRYGSFLVPTGTKVRRRQHDPDNWKFFITPPKSKTEGPLVLWAGVNLGGGDRAPEEWLLDANSVVERWVPGGYDARGKAPDGKNWRYFISPVDVAFYLDASDEATRFFDRIIDSACFRQQLAGDATKQDR